MSTAKLTPSASAKKATEADENLKKFYLELAHRLCAPPDNPDSESAWLWKLHAMSQKMVRLFATLNEHSAFDQVTAIHRACGHFLMKNDVPQKERRQVIDILASWSSLFVCMLQARANIAPMQEEYVRRIREIRRLATPEPAESTGKSPETEITENIPESKDALPVTALPESKGRKKTAKAD